jgi:O-antigen ligase
MIHRQSIPTARAAWLFGDGSDAARFLAIAAAACVFVMEGKVRNRSATASLNGSVDAQVGVELMVVSTVAILIAIRRVSRERSSTISTADPNRFSSSRRGAIYVLRLIVVVCIISSFWSPTAIAAVRAAQLGMLTELCVELQSLCAKFERGFEVFCRQLRSVLLFGVSAAFGFAILLPGYDLFQTDYSGVQRLHLLAMHPIASADLLGTTALMVAGTSFAGTGVAQGGFPDRSQRMNRWRSLLIIALLLACVVLTRERGSIVATFAAVGLMIFSLERTPRLRVAILTGLIMGCVVLGTVGNDLFRSLVLRGQSPSALSSLSGRTEIWAIAFGYFARSPLVGAGYLAGRSIYLANISYGGRSHNAFVEVAVSLGLVGLCLYGLLFLRMIRQIRHALTAGDRVRSRRAWLASSLMVFAVLVGLIDDSFAGTPGLMSFVLALAVVSADIVGQPSRSLSSGPRREQVRVSR